MARRRGTDDSTSLRDLLHIAATSLKQGNKEGARVLIQQVLDADKHNDRAWVLMAFAADDPVDRQRFLRTALRINPQNKTALQAIAKMKKMQEKSQSRALYYGTLGLVFVLVIAVVACILVLIAG